MERKLQKPHFVKLMTLDNLRDGYNVYVKVISVEKSTSQIGHLEIAKVVVADQTGYANAFFKGQTVKLITKGSVIAIRNGRIKLIKGHISLEIDIFGRVTEENMEIKANQTNNISEKQIIRKPRFNRPRSSNKRQDNKPYLNKHRSENPQRNGEKRQNRRRRENEEKPNRPRMEWSKIGSIQPGDENLNITARVISVQNLKNRSRVVIGDQTGTAKAFLQSNEHLKEGNTIVLFRCEAVVVKEHIEIQNGRVDLAKNKNIEKVDESINISEKAWIQSA